MPRRLDLTPDYEDRIVRFDMNTAPGQGNVYATEQYNGLDARSFSHDAFGHDHDRAYDGVRPVAFDSLRPPLLYSLDHAWEAL